MRLAIFKYTFIIVLFNINVLLSQTIISLEQAIELGQISSNLFIILEKEKIHSELELSIFNKEMTPSIFLEGQIPNFTKYTTRVTTPSGEDVFATQNQAFYDARISIEQKEPLLGGKFTMNSYWNKIDIFGENSSSSYFSTPFSLSYSNNDFLYNSYKWEKKINKIKEKENDINYNEQLESIAYKVVNNYFDLFLLDRIIHESEESLKDRHNFLQVAKKRFQLGSINKGDLLTLKLNLLDMKLILNRYKLDRNASQQNLKSLLKLETDSLILKKPNNNILSMSISHSVAINKMKELKKYNIEFQRKMIEKESDIREIKSKDKLSLNISTYIGYSNTADNFEASTKNLQDEQVYSLSVKYSIFDFGKNKQKVKLINLEKEILNTEYNESLDFNTNNLIYLIDTYNMLISDIGFVNEKKELARERYNYLKSKFTLGNVTVTELNISQSELAKLESEYLNMLKEVWLTYYTIRKETMFDFRKLKNISY